MKRLLPLLLCVLLPAAQAAGGEVLHHSGASVRHSAESIGHSARASTALVSGAVAVPLEMVGAVGQASAAAADAAWSVADGGPLPVGEAVTTAGPNPAEALAQPAARR